MKWFLRFLFDEDLGEIFVILFILFYSNFVDAVENLWHGVISTCLFMLIHYNVKVNLKVVASGLYTIEYGTDIVLVTFI